MKLQSYSIVVGVELQLGEFVFGFHRLGGETFFYLLEFLVLSFMILLEVIVHSGCVALGMVNLGLTNVAFHSLVFLLQEEIVLEEWTHRGDTLVQLPGNIPSTTTGAFPLSHCQFNLI